MRLDQGKPPMETLSEFMLSHGFDDKTEESDPYVIEEDTRLDKMYLEIETSMRLILRDYESMKRRAGIDISKQNAFIVDLKRELNEFQFGSYRSKAMDLEKERWKSREDLEKLARTDQRLDEEQGELIKTIQKMRQESIALTKSIIVEKTKKRQSLKVTERNKQGIHAELKLEKRIQNTKEILGKQVYDNEKLRETIRIFKIFDNLYYDAEQLVNSNMQEIKEEMKTALGLATLTFTQYKEVQLKRNVNIAKNEREEAAFKQEVREMKLRIKYDEKMRHFMSTKINERLEQRLDELLQKKNRDQEKQLATENKLLEQYERALQQIRELTKENNILVICNNFQTEEEEIFSMHSYMTEMGLVIQELDILLDRVTNDLNSAQKKQKEMAQEKIMFARSCDDCLGEYNLTCLQLEQIKRVHDKKLANIKNEVDNILTLRGRTPMTLTVGLYVPTFDTDVFSSYLCLVADECWRAAMAAKFCVFRMKRFEDGSRMSITIPMKDVGNRPQSEVFEVTIPSPIIINTKNLTDDDATIIEEMTGLPDVPSVPLSRAELIARAIVKIDLQHDQTKGDDEISILTSIGQKKIQRRQQQDRNKRKA